MATGRYGAWTDADLKADGKQISYLHVPHATTRSAYGVVDIPLAIVGNGAGPSVLLMGGNHGDEYEGQVVLCDLVRELEPEDINGRVIIMPAANLPAAMAGTRVSPLDGGNLNASFPGAYGGQATEQIAHFVDSVLLPQCDAWLDLHAGGSSLEYLPFACIHKSENPALDSKALAALRAFGSSLALVWAYQEERAASSAAHRHDVVYLYGEFGGAGTVNPDSVRLVRAGVIRCLAHLGVLRDQSRFGIDPPAPETRFIQVPYENYATNPPLLRLRPRGRVVRAVASSRRRGRGGPGPRPHPFRGQSRAGTGHRRFLHGWPPGLQAPHRTRGTRRLPGPHRGGFRPGGVRATMKRGWTRSWERQARQCHRPY